MSLVPVGLRDDITLYASDTFQFVDSHAMGKMLYPQSDRSEKRIIRIYNRNKNHFSEKDTAVLKVGTAYTRSFSKGDIESQIDSRSFDGIRVTGHQPNSEHLQIARFIQKKEARFFTIPFGVMKICKFSRSPRAIDVIEKLFLLQESYFKGALAKPDPTLDYVAQLPKGTHVRAETLKELAKKAGVSVRTIRRRVEHYKKGESLENRLPGMVRFTWEKHRGKFFQVMKLRTEGYNVPAIVKKTGVPCRTVYRWFKKEPNDYDHISLKFQQLPVNVDHGIILNNPHEAVND
jgi:hypothetical protein